MFTGSKVNGDFGPWYLTVPGLFIIMHLKILSNIEPYVLFIMDFLTIHYGLGT